MAQLGVNNGYNEGNLKLGDLSINTVVSLEQYINSIQYITLTASFHYYSIGMPNDEYYNGIPIFDEYYDGTLIFDGSLLTILE